MRLGLFGGTFDPIHVGHLDVARAAQRALRLDALWIIPSFKPPHRSAPRASAAHRFAMAALATSEDPDRRLLMCDVEMTDTGPSYTSGTLDRIEGLGLRASDLFFVTGADAFRDIATWKDYPQILDRCHFVAVSRPGAPAASLRGTLPSLAARMVEASSAVPARPTVFLVDAPTSPVSSTDVRRAIASGRSLDGMVPPAVAEYIARQRLYAVEAPALKGQQD